MRRTNCAIASGTSCFCGRTRPPSPFATRWIRRRCRSAPGARSCRPTASAAAACTGMPRHGAFCPAISCCKTHLTERYGANFLPDDMTIQDWGVTYDDLEPHYDRVRISLRHLAAPPAICTARFRTAAIRSKGRARGPIPIRRRNRRFGHTLFAKAARELGYKPFPQPSGNMSQAYVNPLGRAAWGRAPIAASANGSAAATIRRQPADHHPAGAHAQIEFRGCATTAKSRASISTRSGKRATGVTFVDTSGEEWEQPADLVILSAYTIFNVQLLLHSSIGAALRSRRQYRRDRPQLHPPDHVERRRLFRQQEIQLQSVHRLRRDRHVHRRVQRR